MRLFPNHDETIIGTLEQLLSRRTTCAAVLESCLARIDERESSVHAWVHVDRQGALKRAHELDREREGGKGPGLLFGIPIGIKDIVDVAGYATAAGSKLLAQQPPVEWDAPIVTRLRRSDAIILGKTVTTLFASFDPPVTRNPWNLDHTPGGSSSGSAAAVACGMCLGAIGSQTGGSITRPASFCGVAGCKPTYGLVSAEGVFPLSPTMDHPGPMARTVVDLAILLKVIAPDTNLKVGEIRASKTPPRIARLRGFFDELADPEMRAAVDVLLSKFRAAGATVQDVALPKCFEDIHRHHRVVMSSEAAAYHKRRFAEHRDDYQPCIAALLEEGLAVSDQDYARSRQHLERARREVLDCFADVDVLACAATRGPAPDASTTGDPAFNSPWSYTGLPVVSFPIALAKNGLPLAIQLIGRPLGEPALFQAAAWCERIAHAK